MINTKMDELDFFIYQEMSQFYRAINTDARYQILYYPFSH